jgi:3',5'-cyclic AMP phosphodiesterase CpdA
VFIQIDGGSENANKTLIALCEFLVGKRVIRRSITLTRLVVGHTHEDIDAMFAKIWKHCRSNFCMTPKEYEQNIKSAFKNKCDVEDVFVVPNYAAKLECHRDQCFTLCSKLESTQLQWIFTAVPVSAQYPCGVRVNYRAYASDDVYEMVNGPNGYSMQKTIVITQPRAGDGSVSGMFTLKSFPTTTAMVPDSFVEGSRADLVKTHREIVSGFRNSRETVAEWDEFLKNAPSDDNVSICG